MAFEKLNDELNYVSNLPDQPNASAGYSPEEVKATFDRAGQIIRDFLNSTLSIIEGYEGAGNIGVTPIDGVKGTDLQTMLEDMVELIKESGAGVVPKSVTGGAAGESSIIADATITSQNIKPAGIQADSIAAVALASLLGGILGSNVKVSDESIIEVSGTKVTGQIPAAALPNTLPADRLTTVAVAQGGTGAVTAVQALENLGAQPKTHAFSIQLPSGGTSWTISTGSVASYVKANSAVIVQPAPASRTEYNDCGVYCSAQGAGSLSFEADSAPGTALAVNILVID